MTTYQSPRCFNKLTYTMLCGLIIASYMIMFSSADDWATITPVPFRESGDGRIRSVYDRCIDVLITGTIVQGQPLIMNDCGLESYQQWVRPSPSDWRLQTSNNLCMDVSNGNINEVGLNVIVNTCNSTSVSQQWVYDGRYLRLRYNSSICLNIKGGISVNSAGLIVSECDSLSIGFAWLEYSISFISGMVRSENTFSHLICPVGSRVINISGRGGDWVDRLSMVCNDGLVLGPVGGVYGKPIIASNCSTGYSSFNLTNGTLLLGRLVAYCKGTSTPIVVIGNGTLNGTGPVNNFVLEGNQQIIGMHVNHGTYINAFAFIYANPLTAMLRPTPRPTSFPANKLSIQPSVHPFVSNLTIESPVYGDPVLFNTIEQYSFCPPGSKIANIHGMAASLVYQITAICDDRKRTTLGPFGTAKGNPVQASLCNSGYNGWNITFGSYIGKIRLKCTDKSDASEVVLGAGLELGAGSIGSMILSQNQRIVGVHIYYNSSGIKAMSILYSDIHGLKPTEADKLFVLWGFIFGFAVCTVIVLVRVHIRKARHAELFRRLDRILPLR